MKISLSLLTNCEENDSTLCNFSNSYGLKSLIFNPTSFKSSDNLKIIDLIHTNKNWSLTESSAAETGLSDFHVIIFEV